MLWYLKTGIFQFLYGPQYFILLLPFSVSNSRLNKNGGNKIQARSKGRASSAVNQFCQLKNIIDNFTSNVYVNRVWKGWLWYKLTNL